MDFSLGEDQLAFGEAIAKFLMVEAAPEALRDIWETQSGRSDELRAQFADQGITAITVPEEFDGLGLGDLDWMQVNRLLGYHAIAETLHETAYLAVDVLKQLQHDSAKGSELAKRWLPRIAAGSTRITLSHPLNPYVSDAGNADLILSWAQGGLYAVTPNDARLTLNPSIDRSRRLYKMDWTPDESRLVCSGEQAEILGQRVINRAGLALSAQLIGLASRMLDLGVDYAAQRKQFGKPIGSFQAVKHQLSDVAVAIEFAWPVIQRAVYAVDKELPSAAAHVSHARLAAGDAALLSARKSLQAHGAMGYTWEADLQMFMKRAWALNASWGDARFHKARVADLVFSKEQALGPTHTFC